MVGLDMPPRECAVGCLTSQINRFLICEVFTKVDSAKRLLWVRYNSDVSLAVALVGVVLNHSGLRVNNSERAARDTPAASAS